MSYKINDKHGERVLASGRGMMSMLDICHRRKLSDENSVLVVHEPDNLDSTWTIYEPLKEEE